MDTIDQLFTACVRRDPDRRAVVDERGSLTYAELDRRVEAFARHLVQAGVRIDDRVALRLEPSREMMIAMLGVLRAGATYLPIDVALPADRVRYLVADSGARLVVDRSYVERERRANAELPKVSPRDGAYLIYTSGTTGQPKGVLVEQRSVVNYVTWFRDRYGVDGTHAAVLLTSYAYDLGYTTLWTTILSGGEVHLPPRAVCEDPTAVARYLREHAISFIKVTPSLLGALITALDRDSCAALRLIVSGGERIRPDDIAALYERCPGALVVNHYGPTETTIGVLTHPIARSSLADFAARPVLGRPIGNTRVYIVTPELRLLPLGEPGELLIGGACVARGYHGREDLTRERFLPDPFAPDGTVYRTGDLARWTPEGTIEFLGRIDRQVKIRGYRVEPAEIEQAIVREFGMQAVVVDKLLGATNRVLCAYCVGDAVEPAAVRARLAEVLPDYMVPAFVIRLPALPRTPNGKLDTARLPDPMFVLDGDPPRTATEQRLLAMWSDVLGVAPAAIGASQNFFELGGNSLLMIQLIAEIDDQFGHTLEIPAFYRDGTIRALAGILDGGAP